MPELPEVETIVRGLARGLAGRRIVRTDAPWPGSVRASKPGVDPVEALERVALGRTIRGVGRRGKLALVELSGGGHLAVHLKMTGRLLLRPSGDGDRYTRVRLALDNGRELAFSDMRRFGYLLPLAPGELEAWGFHAGLGPEPLESRACDLACRLAGRRARIKSLLLDQRVLAGVGNIYADEALHRAGIRPDRAACRISRTRLEGLCRAVQEVLAQGIAENGASIRDYRDAGGNAGAFQNSFRVYGRSGESCTACGAGLKAVKVAGRTSTFCPGCQR